MAEYVRAAYVPSCTWKPFAFSLSMVSSAWFLCVDNHGYRQGLLKGCAQLQWILPRQLLILKFAAFIERKVLASSSIASCFNEHLERKLSFLTVEMFSLVQIFFVENIGGILQFHIFWSVDQILAKKVPNVSWSWKLTVNEKWMPCELSKVRDSRPTTSTFRRHC